MTLKELKKRVDYCYEMGEHYHDLEVCIPNNKSGMVGSTPTTKVKYANKGFDWNAGKFIIFPEVIMIEKPN